MGKLRCRLVLGDSGADLRVVHFEWHEALSELFSGEVLFESPDADLALDSLLWTFGMVLLFDEDALARCFTGIIEQASYAGEHRHGVFHYRVRLLPQVHALAYRVRSRIFQGVDVKALVKQLCDEAGLAEEAFDWRTEHPTYPVYEYRTQYKESELAFVQRLLAAEGIFFWFEHDELGHRMLLADAPSVHAPIAPEVLYTDHARTRTRELATDLRFGTQLVRDAYTLRDWDWQKPAKPAEAKVGDPNARGLHRYDYPGGFIEPVDGGRHADDRLASERVEQYLLSARSNHLGLAPGRTFSLDGARPGFLNRGFLLLQCTHVYDERGAAGEAGAAQRDWAFTTHLRATHDDTIYRPRLLPKPKVHGVESAVITSAGDEIHVDQWGRVKVHMHWDRESALDDKASCFLRVQQQNLSGSMFLPRLGWEMSVGFHDGDPDRPVVLQKLYNRETMPPYELPGNLTQAALQSSSSPGGGGSNELRMQDSSGAQGFIMHAQRDLVLDVGNDSTETIAVDLEEVYKDTLDVTIGIDESVEVAANQSFTIKGDAAYVTGGNKDVSVGAEGELGVKGIHTSVVGGDRSETIGAMQSVQAVSMSETFAADHTQSIGGALALTAAKVVSEAVAGNKTLNIGGAYLIKATGAFGESSGKAKLLTAGATSYESKGAMSLNAKQAIQIKVGGKLKEKVTGKLAVSGKKLKITAKDGAMLDGGGTKLELKGGAFEINGDDFGVKAGIMLSLRGKISYK